MPSDNRSTEMKKFLERAEDIAQSFPEESMNTFRKYSEVVIQELAEKFDCADTKSKHINHRQNNTMKNLRDYVPNRLYYFLQHLINMGNYGSHFQEDGVEPSVEDAEYCLYTAREIFQWMYPNLAEDPIAETAVFIENAADAVLCSTCGRNIGEKCIGVSTGTVWKTKIHQDRRINYSIYRRDFQKHYRTSIVEAMHEMVDDIKLDKGQTIKVGEIVSWFKNRYPAYSDRSVRAHTSMMATNAKRNWNVSETKEKRCNLFFRIKRGIYRLYDPSTDPTPTPFTKLV